MLACGFVIAADHRGKIRESEKIELYLPLASAEKAMEHGGDGYIVIVGAQGTVLSGMVKKSGVNGNQMKKGDYTEHSIV